jgi:hypothetical protein
MTTAPIARSLGTRDGGCPCTGPECATPRIELVPGGVEVHHPDPTRAGEIATAAGDLYVALINHHAEIAALTDELRRTMIEPEADG